MKAILLFLILIFVCSNVSAQEVKIFNDINKTSIVNNNKLTIDKSNDNIWISTNNGIKIWNGSTFIKYTTLNSGLPSNKINCIFIEGVNKWIGTDSGLTKFDGNTWTNYNSNIHPQLNNVYSITKDNSGLYWIATGYKDSLLKFDGTNWTTVLALPFKEFTSYDGFNIVFYTNGSVYASTGAFTKGGLYRFNGSVFDTITSDMPLAGFIPGINNDTAYFHVNNCYGCIFADSMLVINGNNISKRMSIVSSCTTQYNVNKFGIGYSNCGYRVSKTNNITNFGYYLKEFLFDSKGDLYGIEYNNSNFDLIKILESKLFCGGYVKQDGCSNNNKKAAGVRLKIQPGNIFTTANLDGFWQIDSLPIGSYTAKIDTSGLIWKNSSCSPDSIVFQIVNNLTPLLLSNFSVFRKKQCAYPKVSISAPWLRRCFTNSIYLQVSNDLSAGQNIPAGTKVKVNIDSNLLVDSASMTYSLVSGSYDFNVPTLAPGQDTLIYIWVTPKCNTTINGQSVCMNAEITPIQQCYVDSIPNYGLSSCNTAYDNTNYMVSSSCAQDSVVFTISNSGTGNPGCPAPMKILLNGYEWLDTSITVNAGSSKIIKSPKTGETYSVIVGNHPLHPLNKNAVAHQEFCGNTNNWFFGGANAWYNPNYSSYYSSFCGVLRASYDPNDKQVTPTGTGLLGAIDSNSSLPMTYTIRFQNTGNDTAVNVVIRDTLSSSLDLSSIKTISSTHPFTFQVLYGGVAQWTFSKIMLVDSATNELLSKGSISYNINQSSKLSYGTQIKNKALIYFDFNEPIITNTVLNTIYKNLSIKYDTLCDSLVYKGIKYTSSRTIIDTIKSKMGADSIILYSIIINKSYNDTLFLNNFYGASYNFEGLSITKSGFYTKKFIKSNGCDSLKNLNIIFRNLVKDTLILNKCKSFLYKNKLYHTSISFTDTIYTNSIDTVRFVKIIIKKDTVFKVFSTCNSLTFNNKTYSTSGKYFDSIAGKDCDTVFILNITIYNKKIDSFDVVACSEIKIGDTIIKKSGSYFFKFKNYLGCDSAVQLNLKIINIDKTIRKEGIYIISNEPIPTGVSYQWYLCNPFQKINGAINNKIFTLLMNASFAVEVTNNACKDTSDCISYNSSAIIDGFEGQMNLYPNPITDRLNIDFGMYIQDAEITVYNVLGSEILSKKLKNTTKEVIDFSLMPSGAYLIKIRSEQFEKTVKVSKF
jgi:hypothetical protein